MLGTALDVSKAMRQLIHFPYLAVLDLHAVVCQRSEEEIGDNGTQNCQSLKEGLELILMELHGRLPLAIQNGPVFPRAVLDPPKAINNSQDCGSWISQGYRLPLIMGGNTDLRYRFSVCKGADGRMTLTPCAHKCTDLSNSGGKTVVLTTNSGGASFAGKKPKAISRTW